MDQINDNLDLKLCTPGIYAVMREAMHSELSLYRKDSQEVQRLSKSPTAIFTLFNNDNALVELADPVGSTAHKYKWFQLPGPINCLESSIDNNIGQILLGLDEHLNPHFALPIADQGLAEVNELVSNIAEGKAVEWLDVRKVAGPRLPSQHAAVYAFAAGMLSWARQTRYDPATGLKLIPSKGGHARIPKETVKGKRSRPVFPRIDPAVIMAVTFGDWLLLGRQSRWSPERYSLLAGFCEVGETLEQTVVRETMEEAGVAVNLSSVRYISSQPWPFPQSLMIGFTAEAINQGTRTGVSKAGEDAIEAHKLDSKAVAELLAFTPVSPATNDMELEAAHWFHRDFLKARDGDLPKGVQFGIPGEYALANIIISKWASEPNSHSHHVQAVPDVEIDIGSFKYVLLQIRQLDGHEAQLVVRGSRDCPFHRDVWDKAVQDIGSNYKIEIAGGGRIDNDTRNIFVYGYSSAYGAAPHEVTAALIQRRYPMANIRFAYEGY